MKQPSPPTMAKDRLATAVTESQQGLALLKQGSLVEAIEKFRRALRITPNSAEMHNNLGVALGRQKQFEDAIHHLEQALTLAPGLVEARSNLALLYLDRKDWEKAIGLLERVVQDRPDSADEHQRLGSAYRAAGKLDAALIQFEEAIRCKPESADAWHDRGLVLALQEKHTDALASYEEAIRLRPEFASAHNNMALLLKDQGRVEEALGKLRHSLELNPHAPETLNNLGVILTSEGQHDEALGFLRRAIENRPDYAEAHNNLGNSLRDLGRLDEALACFRIALKQKPDYAEAYNNLGIARLQQGQLVEALNCYARALALKPDYPDARKNRSFAWLTAGEFQRGWAEYEWRWDGKALKLRHTDRPRWNGEPIDGRTILLYSEQGFGDTLQFIRYARLVKQRGARVLVECPGHLVRLLTRCPGIDALIPEGSPLPEFDFQSPILSLPRIFGTTLNTIPAQVPYLGLDPALTSRWREQLGSLSGFKIGIAWQGNPKYGGDRHRSIPLRAFAPLAQVSGIHLISLQKGPGVDQLKGVKDLFPVVELGPDVDSKGAFMDTAAIIKNLDLVIASDSAVAHLAGALGMPLWMAVPIAPDWRWLLHRDDCPWYPTMRLFRQSTWGDWDELMRRIAQALAQRVSSRTASSAGDSGTSADRVRGWLDGGKFPGAKPRLREALASRPDSPKIWQQLGVSLAEQGDHHEAVVCFREVMRLDPTATEAHVEFARSLLQTGRADEATAHLRQRLEVTPNSAELHNQLGVALACLRQFDAAETAYRRALQLKPELADAHHNLGNLLRGLGRLSDARACYGEALRYKPESAEIHYDLGVVLGRLQQLDEGQKHFQTAIRLNPFFGPAHHGLASVYTAHGQIDEAVDSLQKALLLSAQRAEVYNDLGNALLSKGETEQAAERYCDAIRERADFPEAHYNLGIALMRQRHFADALASYREAVRLRPDYPDAYNNMGACLRETGKFAEAAECFQATIRINPNHAEAHWNLALSLLQRGNFEEGWPEYEWRWKCPTVAPRVLGRNVWDGSPLEGKTILLSADGSADDVLQFVRYAPLVQQLGGRVLVEAPPVLQSVLGSCPGIDQLIPEGSSPPSFDVFLPLLSLPAVLKTTRASIPTTIPYLSAPPPSVEHWRRCLQHLRGLKVGLALQGEHAKASPSLSHLLASTHPVHFVNVGSSLEWVRALAEQVPLVEFLRRRDDPAEALTDTAAILTNLNLVIVSDCLLAHLAGALGLPVWVLLRHPGHWRWMEDGETSVWYPTMRLFRERSENTEDEVMDRITRALLDHLQEREN